MDAVEIARESLEQDTTLESRTPLSVIHVCDLLTLCLTTTYFIFEGVHYLQKHGCAMGSPVSPIVVNLYMEAFEKRALSEFTGTAPRVWLRYVDDIFKLIKKAEREAFFEFVNQLDKHLKFTREAPNEQRELPYLDSLPKVEEDGSVSFRVYRKPTHTDQYLQFQSHHPLVHKLAVIRTLFYRADTIVSDLSEQRQEKQHIKSALRTCGYPDWVYPKAEKTRDDTRKQPPVQSGSGRQCRITIPYVSGLSERLKKTFRAHNISVSFKPYNTLRQQLVNVKDKTPRDNRCNLVYGYKCPAEDCGKTYVGETKQALKQRLSQHRKPSYGAQYNSAIYTHMCETGHSFTNKDVKILDKEEDWHSRGVKEAIHTRIEKPHLTTKLRHNLSHAWDPALRALPCFLSSSNALQKSSSRDTAEHQQLASAGHSV